jgi:Rifampin ADP-ribosyl transferase
MSGPFYHGTATEYQPGDLVSPEYELGRRRGQPGRVFATTDPGAARGYGAHKAAAQHAIGNTAAEARAYQVEPTGPVEPDRTVDARFAAWQTTAPMRVIADVTEPEPEAGL